MPHLPALPPDRPRVVHVDTTLVVVEKPAGLSSVLHPEEASAPRRGGQRAEALSTMLPRILQRMASSARNTVSSARNPASNKSSPTAGVGGKTRKSARGAEQARPVRVVQRLDKATSGLLVFARTVLAERDLGEQFRKHTVQRRYLALVQGRLDAPLRIESKLVPNRGDGRRGSHPSQGLHAVTHVTPLEDLGRYTLVACRLETGRTHQIRIHLSEAGHPLCGETVYNRPPFGDPWPDASGARRLMLHAAELGFRHPGTQAQMQFSMDPPEDFTAVLTALRGRITPRKAADYAGSGALPRASAGPVPSSPAGHAKATGSRRPRGPGVGQGRKTAPPRKASGKPRRSRKPSR